MLNNTYTLYRCYEDLMPYNHILIGGATGSGKSVLLNGFVYSLLCLGNHSFVFIDLKRVELNHFKNVNRCLYYADNKKDTIFIFRKLVEIMEQRYKTMQELKQKKSTEDNIWVIIDEYADLMLECREQVIDNINKLLILGRASNIHLIIATQRATVKLLGDFLKINCDLKIALRVGTKQESRNIIDQAGAETLTTYGYGIYKSPLNTSLYKIEMIPEEEIKKIIELRARK